MDERLERTVQALREVGADWAVLASVDGVGYATGHFAPVEAGPSPFAGGPTVALIDRNGVAGIACANVEAAAAGASRVTEVELYEGYAFDHGVDYIDSYRTAVGSLARRLGVGGRLAGERGHVPQILGDVLPVDTALDLTPPLRRLRATKTAEELAALRRSAEAVAIGQRRFLEALRPGRSELAVFAEIRCAIEEFAGCRVPITGDFISGAARSSAFTGWPIHRVIEPGDPVMADLAPRIDGYWGDSCATTSAGPASKGFMKLFEASKGALTHALEIIRPGMTAQELDAQLRAYVGRHGFTYPHHSGHSIGTAVHEFPRLVPYETAVLEPDMVLLVEPGCYDPEIGGVRSEYMIRVTGDGCEILHPFDHVPSV
ncbi:MAG: M24 family metallopeptidase [Geminicoccaceae bacterium]